MKQVDVVIPVYNSSETVATLVDRLNSWAAKTTLEPHVIFVDDGSRDATFMHLGRQLEQAAFPYSLIRLARNYGQHTATATGFSVSTAGLVATLDDDLQHDPSDIDKLFACMQQTGSDLVYGSFAAKKHHATRNFGTRLLQWLLRIEGRDYSMVTSFRLMRSHVISTFRHKQDRTHFIDDFLLLASSSVSSCAISHAGRLHGRSGYTMAGLFKMASLILILHSSVPLRLISRMGLVMSLVFFVLGCYYIYDKLFNDVSIGFTSLIVAIFFSTGLILFSLGIIGEYIRRIWTARQELDRVIIAESCRS